MESGLKLVNKLTSDHINLTFCSVMRVNLVAQVLSKTVANVLNNFGPEEAKGWQSREGLQITVLSFKEGCKFLSQQDIPYILSEKFCQDDLENYFGKQRAIGRRSDNPTLHDFGYDDNIVKNQFLMRPIGGNVQGPAKKFNEICNEPLPKRRK